MIQVALTDFAKIERLLFYPSMLESFLGTKSLMGIFLKQIVN